MLLRQLLNDRAPIYPQQANNLVVGNLCRDQFCLHAIQLLSKSLSVTLNKPLGGCDADTSHSEREACTEEKSAGQLQEWQLPKDYAEVVHGRTLGPAEHPVSGILCHGSPVWNGDAIAGFGASGWFGNPRFMHLKKDLRPISPNCQRRPGDAAATGTYPTNHAKYTKRICVYLRA